MPAAHECLLVLHYCEWHGDDLQYTQYTIILRKLTSPKHVIVGRLVMTTCKNAWWESQQQLSPSCTVLVHMLMVMVKVMIKKKS